MKAATLRMRRWRKKNRNRQRAADRRFRKKHSKRINANQRKKYWINRKKHLARNAKYHRDNRKKVAKRHRLVAFRMSSEQHDLKLKNQNKRCAVCRTRFTETPHIDHNHNCCSKRPTCGLCTRGLLCHDCNLGLGRFKDDIKVLKNAIKYLREYTNGSRQQNRHDPGTT